MRLKLFGKITSQLRDSVFGDGTTLTGDSENGLCAHCNTHNLHDVRTEEFVLKKFKMQRARGIAWVLLPKIKANPDGREEIVNEAIKEEDAKE